MNQPLLKYLGANLGIVTGNYVAHLWELDAARVFVAMLLLLIPALVGARLTYVVIHWRAFQENTRRIWGSRGGATLYGGLPFSLLASVPLLELLQLPFGAFWDLAAISILVAMVFGRIDCMLKGCCAGRVTKGRFTMYLPNLKGEYERRIPTQVLEAGWAMALLLGAVVTWGMMPFQGSLFLYALTGYGLGRFVFESFREHQDAYAGIPIHRAISVALVVLSLAIYLTQVLANAHAPGQYLIPSG